MCPFFNGVSNSVFLFITNFLFWTLGGLVGGSVSRNKVVTCIRFRKFYVVRLYGVCHITPIFINYIILCVILFLIVLCNYTQSRRQSHIYKWTKSLIRCIFPERENRIEKNSWWWWGEKSSLKIRFESVILVTMQRNANESIMRWRCDGISDFVVGKIGVRVTRVASSCT